MLAKKNPELGRDGAGQELDGCRQDTPTLPVCQVANIFFKKGEVIEIRALGLHGKGPWGGWAKDTVSGYFDDPAKFAAAAKKLDDLKRATGIYYTINPVDPALLARANNRLVVPKAATTDEQVACQRWLLVDTDPHRPSGISATDTELEAAITCRNEIADYLHEHGLPDPIRAYSGNGGHLLYRLPDLPNTAEIAKLKKQSLRALKHKFDSASVGIDQTVANASRVTKLYGTLARKGDSMSDRPHRRSSLEIIPEPIVPVTSEQLRWLASQAPKDKTDSYAQNPQAGGNSTGKKRYAEKVLQNCCEQIRQSPSGDQHCTRRNTARLIGGYLQYISEGEVLSALEQAVRASGAKDMRASMKTIRDGLAYGELSPITIPDIESAHSESNSTDGEGDKKKKETQADILIKLALNNIFVLFEDQYSVPFACIQVDKHRENWPLKSVTFKRWLGSLYYSTCKKACNDEATRTAIDTLAAHAIYGGKGIIELYNRVAWKDGAIWYDLSNENWQAVKITSDGWELVDNPPILFRRFANQTAQVIPAKNGSIERLLEITNLKDTKSETLAKIWLVSTLIPAIPHSIVVLYGPQGSAKTSFFRYMKDLIDPGIKKTDSMPRTPEDLIKKLNNNWLCPFDNVSKIQVWQSDCICRAVTGEGYSQRMLYTNNEEMILQFQRVVALNGINVVATSPDLLDRCIILELGRIPKSKRKKENTLQKEFDKAKPFILGSMFDVLSKAMKFYSKAEKKLKELPRMADFATWGYAIAEAMNDKGDEFIKAYYENIKFQNQQVIDSDPVASCLINFMAKQDEWEGPPDELLKELGAIAETSGIQIKSKIWPKQPNTLTRRLNNLKVNLSELGFDIKTSIHTEKGNTLRVAKIPSVASVASESNNISNLDTEANLKQTEGKKNTFRIPSGSEPTIHAGLEAMKQLKVKYPYSRREDNSALDMPENTDEKRKDDRDPNQEVIEI